MKLNKEAWVHLFDKSEHWGKKFYYPTFVRKNADINKLRFFQVSTNALKSTV